jgi:hypothetical protein
MNYILEVYSDGMFIPITGSAILETQDAITLEFGIDDNFDNPDWMKTSIYKMERQPVVHDFHLQQRLEHPDPKVAAFLWDAKRDILTYLDRTGFWTA